MGRVSSWGHWDKHRSAFTASVCLQPSSLLVLQVTATPGLSPAGAGQGCCALPLSCFSFLLPFLPIVCQYPRRYTFSPSKNNCFGSRYGLRRPR